MVGRTTARKCLKWTKEPYENPSPQAGLRGTQHRSTDKLPSLKAPSKCDFYARTTLEKSPINPGKTFSLRSPYVSNIPPSIAY